MSHLKERKEKVCLNCGANLYGRYCHICGQENLEPKETVWHLVTHFFNDITHFDGKFFSTVKYLLTRPGFLASEYMIGRRASYLNPIRMYVFTSAFFFLMLFSMTSADKMLQEDDKPQKPEVGKGVADWENKKASVERRMKNTHDSSDYRDYKEQIKRLDEDIAAAKKLYGDTTTRKFTQKEIGLIVLQANLGDLKKSGMPDVAARAISRAADSAKNRGDDEDGFWSSIGSDKYPNIKAYDSIQHTLPDSVQDGWFKKIMYRKLIRVKEEVRKDKKGYKEHFWTNMLHSFPKILFVSLPFFALILKLVYIRRKNFYYTNHGIFAINFYCAIFILLLLVILLNQVVDSISWQWVRVILDIVIFAIWVYMFIYLYKAMRGFYKQRRFKTFVKYLIVCFLAFVVDIFLLMLFIVISAISV